MDLLQQAFIFLAAGVIAVPIASRLGLGSVLGYLIAGIIVGPFILNLVHDAESTLHFAEFGVVMMLFLIGLELQPARLWRMRNPIVGLGGLQVLLTTLVIAGLAMLFGFAWQTAIAIGLILALSSTALALQILSEKHLMGTESGKSSFAVLLFQDIAVIPIIAMLPLLVVSAPAVVETAEKAAYGGNMISHMAAWKQTLIVIGVVVGLILAGHFLTRPLFRFIAESRLREIFTATALLLVVGTAYLMYIVGLSPALGAFIAGVVLADSEYRHELEANIDPFKALLLGLFFISVGAGIDFGLLIEQPLLIMGLLIALVVIKFGILWGLAKFFNLHGGDRYWFTFALAQGGEFGFVLLSFALQNDVLPRDIASILTVTIALSMVLTPILIVFNEKWIQPHYRSKQDGEGEDEEIENIEMENNTVIIAGFGRFGQIVGRLLMANDIPVTVLDNNPSHIERLRRFGYKVFYGDPSREDLLHTAGAEKAKLLIVAIDDRVQINQIIEISKHKFPHLKVIARAYDVLHYHELQKLGVDHIERELFQASLKVGEKALNTLGMRAFQARRQVLQFTILEKKAIDSLSQHMDDSKTYLTESRRAHDEVLALLQKDSNNHHLLVAEQYGEDEIGYH